jgi:hypothetical protein
LSSKPQYDGHHEKNKRRDRCSGRDNRASSQLLSGFLLLFCAVLCFLHPPVSFLLSSSLTRLLVRFSGDALQSNWSQSRRLLYTDQNREAKMEIPVEETRQYIRDFDRLAGMTETARELYDKMLELYPERVNPLPLWLSARTAKP